MRKDRGQLLLRVGLLRESRDGDIELIVNAGIRSMTTEEFETFWLEVTARVMEARRVPADDLDVVDVEDDESWF